MVHKYEIELLKKNNFFPVSDISDCVDRHSLARHLKLNKFLEDYEQSLEALVNDDKMKKFRFDCQASKYELYYFLIVDEDRKTCIRRYLNLMDKLT